MAAAKKSFKEVGKSVKQMNSGVAGFGTTQKDRRSTDANPTISPTQKSAKKSFKEVGKSVKQMNSGVAGFGTTQKDRRSTAANPPITPTRKSAAASNVGTPGSIGAQNMTQFFEENGDVGDPPKGTLLGHKDNKGSGQDAVAAGAAPPAQKINNAEPKRVAVRVFQARDIAAADSGFFSGPTSDP